MGKVLECVYAYIYKNNYAGACSLGKQIYTLTEGLTARENDMLAGIMPTIDNAGVAKIDNDFGVKINGTKVNPDFDMVSFAYYPLVRGSNHRAICRFGLRKSLRERNVRGSKEIAHALILENEKYDGYFVDFIDLDSGFFANDAYKDIALDDSQAVLDDAVYEMKPARLEPVDIDMLSSSALMMTDIYNLGTSAPKIISEILHALFTAQKNKKTTYIIYNPEDWEVAKEYIRVALKLLPSQIANELSFITCYGRTDSISVDICGIPTCDNDYIAMLEKKGCAVKISGPSATGAVGIGGIKAPFAEFLYSARDIEIEKWLDESVKYYKHIKKLEEINDTISLYLNKESDSTNGSGVSLKQIAECIKLITNNLELIAKIPLESKEQIESVKNRIDLLCVNIQNITVETIHDELFLPLIHLMSECKRYGIEEQDLIANTLYAILFGVQGQSEESERKRFEILSLGNSKILQELKSNNLDIIRYLESKWMSLQPLFENYFGDRRFREYAATFSLELLKMLLADVERSNDIYSDIRDYFVSAYLGVKSNQLIKMLSIAFSATSHAAVFNYSLNTLLKPGVDSELYADRVNTFCKYIEDNGMLQEAVTYFRDKYVMVDYEKEEIISVIFEKLLTAYIKQPTIKTLDELYNGFITAKAFLGEYENVGLSMFIYDFVAQHIINPIYEEAIRAIRFDDINDSDIERYQELLRVYSKNEYSQKIDAKFCGRLRTLFDSYDVYKNQTKRENNLIDCRIDFITRELLLLDGKTILYLLNTYIGEKQVLDRFYHEGIEGKIIKHERFLEVAGAMAKEFLLDKGKTLSASELNTFNQKKNDFAKEIRELKSDRNKGSRFRRFSDSTLGLIGSSVFAAIIAVIAGIASYLIYEFVANEYFLTIYIAFPIISFFVAEIMYWYNYRDRRLRNITVVATWQTLCVVMAMYAVYVLLQYIFVLLF